jgi:predicted enzyme related to lactoylglutathione lyase
VGNHGFVQNPDGTGIPGGVGGGSGYPARVLFYLGLPDVEAALREAERLGGVRILGPDRPPKARLSSASLTPKVARGKYDLGGDGTVDVG